MRRIEEAGLAGLARVMGRHRADRVADVYRDHVLPQVEAATYRLSSTGRTSRDRLAALHGHYAGSRCFILGNGPSINATDLSQLKGEFTFALNRGYLLADRLGGPATFLVAVNRYVIEQFASELVNAGSQLFAGWRSRMHFAREADVTYIRRARRYTFSTDVAHQGASEGPTVTYLALQLAFHMGFEEVVLLGVDHSFTTTGPANQLVTSRGADPNHFDPRYFGAGIRWQLPDLQASEVVYRLANQVFTAHRRRVIDATVDGKLTVFSKGELHGLLRRRR